MKLSLRIITQITTIIITEINNIVEIGKKEEREVEIEIKEIKMIQIEIIHHLIVILERDLLTNSVVKRNKILQYYIK